MRGCPESVGVPTDYAGVKVWKVRYGTEHAKELLDRLRSLNARRLPADAVTDIALALVYAFKMGEDFEGKDE